MRYATRESALPPDQTPQDALREFLGPLAEEVEIKDG